MHPESFSDCPTMLFSMVTIFEFFHNFVHIRYFCWYDYCRLL